MLQRSFAAEAQDDSRASLTGFITENAKLSSGLEGKRPRKLSFKN